MLPLLLENMKILTTSISQTLICPKKPKLIQMEILIRGFSGIVNLEIILIASNLAFTQMTLSLNRVLVISVICRADAGSFINPTRKKAPSLMLRETASTCQAASIFLWSSMEFSLASLAASEGPGPREGTGQAEERKEPSLYRG